MIHQKKATGLLEDVARQVEGAELYESRSLALPVTFRAGALESVKAVETTGRALRVIKDGRLGFSTTTDLTDSTTFIRNTLESAQFGDPAPFEFPAQQPSDVVSCYDAEVERLDESTLITLGEEIVERISAYDPELQVDISIDKRRENVSLMNTSGLELKDRRTSFAVTIEITRAREGDILFLYEDIRSRRREDVDGSSAAGRMVEKLRWTEKEATVASGAMPVVFADMATLCLTLPLTFGLNGRYVYLGVSPLGERIGQQALDRRFTFLDDGRLDYAARSAAYDDEGTPTSRQALIRDGVVQRFLYDLKTAAQAGVEPTGNGFKSDGMMKQGFELPPSVVPTTSQVPAGSQSLEQILGELNEALLVYEVLGLGQGNILAGEFSNNVSLGFLVRHGEIVGRVKNTMIAGNVYDLLSDQLIGLSDRSEWVWGMLHAPAIAINAVGVASQG